MSDLLRHGGGAVGEEGLNVSFLFFQYYDNSRPSTKRDDIGGNQKRPDIVAFSRMGLKGMKTNYDEDWIGGRMTLRPELFYIDTSAMITLRVRTKFRI